MIRSFKKRDLDKLCLFSSSQLILKLLMRILDSMNQNGIGLPMLPTTSIPEESATRKRYILGLDAKQVKLSKCNPWRMN
jgi:hypothetical protein